MNMNKGMRDLLEGSIKQLSEEMIEHNRQSEALDIRLSKMQDTIYTSGLDLKEQVRAYFVLGMDGADTFEWTNTRTEQEALEGIKYYNSLKRKNANKES